MVVNGTWKQKSHRVDEWGIEECVERSLFGRVKMGILKVVPPLLYVCEAGDIDENV